MEFGSVFDLAEYLKTYRKKFIIPHEQDFAALVCGRERTSKSTLSIFLGNYIDPDFQSKNICFTVEEYIKFQLGSTYFKGADMPEGCTPTVHPGSSVIFDEGGTQAYSREFYSDENIALNKVFIGAGVLNLMHFICVPKPKSLDEYLREERTEMFIYNYFTTGKTYKTLNRGCIVYLRNMIDRILDTPRWWKYFRNNRHLRRKFHPDGEFEIPDLSEHIPAGLVKEYKGKKKLFCRNLLIGALNTSGDKKNNGGDKGDVLVDVAGEINVDEDSTDDKVYEWERRTGLSRKSFFIYRAKAARKRLEEEMRG